MSMAGMLFLALGLGALGVLAVGFFFKRRIVMLVGWFVVVAAVAAGVAGY